MKTIATGSLVTLIKIFLLNLVLVSQANAVIYLHNGVWYGTVCRNGPYFTDYDLSRAQPVGSPCPVRDPYGRIIAMGWVTNE